MITPAPISTLRFALRIANAFTLDLLKIYSRGRDFTDVLILAALMQSKAARLIGNPGLQRRYAVFAAPVPKDLRRAISVNALSASLGLPFETVRRRTKRLVREGLCEAAADGVRISERMLVAEAHRDTLQAAYESVRNLHLRLLRGNCLQFMELPPSAAEVSLREDPPVRIVERGAAQYFLRTMELFLPNFSNLTQAFVMLEVVRANTAGMPDALRGEDRLDADAFVPDNYRRPVRASEVAESLSLPHETVRRHLVALVEDGRCQRSPEGVIVPAAVLARPEVTGAFAANFQNLRRMFTDLTEAGVLARWEAELAPRSIA